MSILFGLLLARRFYCRSALSLSPGRTGGLLPRINAPIKKQGTAKNRALIIIIVYVVYILKPVMLTTVDAAAVPVVLTTSESSNLKSNLALRETRLPVEAFTTAVITALE